MLIINHSHWCENFSAGRVPPWGVFFAFFPIISHFLPIKSHLKLSIQNIMLNRVGLNRLAINRSFTRNFQSSNRSMNKIFGSPQEGPYSNIPFQVKNRKLIPFSFYYWGVLGFFFAFPFLSTYWHLKKSGSFLM